MGKAGGLLTRPKQSENQKPRKEMAVPPPCPCTEAPTGDSPFPEAGPVKGAMRAVCPGKRVRAQWEWLPVTPTGVAQDRCRVSEPETLPSCAREEGGRTLIAFAVPNPNPDHNLAAPQMRAGEQGMWAVAWVSCPPCVWPEEPLKL